MYIFIIFDEILEMSRENNLNKLEKDIRVKMINIKSGKISPKDSGIGKLINMLKTLDEPLYDSTLIEYKNILKNL